MRLKSVKKGGVNTNTRCLSSSVSPFTTKQIKNKNNNKKSNLTSFLEIEQEGNKIIEINYTPYAKAVHGLA